MARRLSRFNLSLNSSLISRRAASVLGHWGRVGEGLQPNDGKKAVMFCVHSRNTPELKRIGSGGKWHSLGP
jgi:hypothetical protein